MSTIDELQARIAELEKQVKQAEKRAKRNEFMATALENASYAFGSGYPDGRLYICNQAFCDMTGYTEEELRAMSWAVDLTPEEWREFEMDKLAQLHRTGEPQMYEKEYIIKDGTRIPVEVETHMTCDEAGEPELYYAFVSDITIRKQALQKLELLYQISRDLNAAHDPDELLQALSQPAIEADVFNATLMYIENDESGEPAWAEKVSAWQREGELHFPVGTRYPFSKFTLADLFLANPKEALIIPDVANDERVDEATKAVFDKTQVAAMVALPLILAGRWVGVLTFEWQEPREFDAQEQEIYTALMGLAAPAVQNQRLVENLEQIAEERTQEANLFKALVENSLDSIAVQDLNTGKLIYANRTCHETFGYDYDTQEMIGRDSMDMWVQEDVPSFLENIAPQIVTTGWRGNARQQRKDGSIFDVEATAFAVHNEQGKPVTMAAIIRDITEQKQAEAERDRLQQEIIEAQQQALRELSTPIIPVMDRILVMPLIGSIDTMRARDITRSLLAGIREHRAKVIILDITGVAVVDSGVADHLNKTIQAARLKGARTVITGISDAVAETIVDLGIDWTGIETLSDLQTGLIAALNSLGVRLSK